jgi:hypothetical protein
MATWHVSSRSSFFFNFQIHNTDITKYIFNKRKTIKYAQCIITYHQTVLTIQFAHLDFGIFRFSQNLFDKIKTIPGEINDRHISTSNLPRLSIAFWFYRPSSYILAVRLTIYPGGRNIWLTQIAGHLCSVFFLFRRSS